MLLHRPRRRRSLRRRFRAPCEAVRLDGFQLLSRELLDLSPRGALIACEAPIEPGDEVVLSFRAPPRGPYIDVVSTVARVICGWREGDPGFAAGVRFEDIEDETTRELVRRLSGLPPTLPARRLPVDYAATVRGIARR